ncbi:Protein trichome berefringence-like 7 [Striga hermonthica]|uniref:Protein trichome berefringence-like 7 n=1 Tax=Striga hermonthica TaxID=68872 RepID=A0A9N7NM89_STRHE|nr:Protein trichome berefringence-like 7 [Striga hermonthica]
MSEVMSSLYFNSVALSKPLFKKAHKFYKLLAANYSKSTPFQSFTAFLMICAIICFFAVMGCTYFYLSPSSETVVGMMNRSKDIINSPNASSKVCNVFDGKWVADESYPLYNASDCPFVERGFDCLANGRKDREYLKWRWKPHNCEIPRFNARKVLELLRGKRVVFVGDSLSRTQWESMVCMLMSGVEEKNSVYEMNGNEITKRIRHLGVRFGTYGLSVEFYRSIFLVQPGPAPKRSPRRVKTVVKLDQLDDVSGEWVDSDVLVFNSGHWWTPTKLFEMGWYFQVGNKIKFGMPISKAFKVALSTWQSWTDSAIDPNRTHVFFRTFESTHWSSGSRQNCRVTTRPSSKPNGRQRSSITDSIVNAVKRASVDHMM